MSEQLRPEQEKYIDTSLKMNGMADALEHLHAQGKIDLNEFNHYFREAMGNISLIRLVDIAMDADAPTDSVLSRAVELNSGKFNLFRGIDLERSQDDG
jgi:hypothetical protein